MTSREFEKLTNGNYNWTNYKEENDKKTKSSIKLRPLGNQISSIQYTQPFLIWTITKIQEFIKKN